MHGDAIAESASPQDDGIVERDIGVLSTTDAREHMNDDEVADYTTTASVSESDGGGLVALTATSEMIASGTEGDSNPNPRQVVVIDVDAATTTTTSKIKTGEVTKKETPKSRIPSSSNRAVEEAFVTLNKEVERPRQRHVVKKKLKIPNEGVLFAVVVNASGEKCIFYRLNECGPRAKCASSIAICDGREDFYVIAYQ
jgi:hypothetical protein